MICTKWWIRRLARTHQWFLIIITVSSWSMLIDWILQLSMTEISATTILDLKYQINSNPLLLLDLFSYLNLFLLRPSKDLTCWKSMEDLWNDLNTCSCESRLEFTVKTWMLPSRPTTCCPKNGLPMLRPLYLMPPHLGPSCQGFYYNFFLLSYYRCTCFFAILAASYLPWGMIALMAFTRH